jgi:hypothetical protein
MSDCVTYPNARDCEHGRQRGKCPYCDLADAEVEIRRLNQRVRELILDRDRWRTHAEQKIALRREVEELLGIPQGPACDEQFQAGVEALRKVMGKTPGGNDGR